MGGTKPRPKRRRSAKRWRKISAKRQKLIDEHPQLISSVISSLPLFQVRQMGLDLLQAAGLRGLTEAAMRFDFDRGVKFSTYALTRIRGEMLDEIRAQDFVGRSVRHSSPDGGPHIKTNQMLQKPTEACFGADASGDMSDSAGCGSLFECIGVPNEEQQIDAADAVAHVLSLVTDEERELLSLYYLAPDALKMRQIGDRIGRTEGRVSQIMKKIKAKIRRLCPEGASDFL